MIHIKLGTIGASVDTENCNTLKTLPDLICAVRTALPKSIKSVRFGSCYERPFRGCSWQRITYIVGIGDGSSTIVGVCDYRPQRVDQILF